MKQQHVAVLRLLEVARGGPALREEQMHLERCSTCSDELLVRQALELDRRLAGAPIPCLDAASLVRVAEGTGLTPSERRRVRRHLPGCPSCASELEALVRAGAAEPRYPVAPPRKPAPGPSLVDRLRDLLAWTMPPSVALAARASAGSARLDGFARAMRAYRAGRFAEARRGLEAARAAGETAPEIDFYLGCCWMRAGKPERALPLLAAAAARRPRIGAYRFSLAQTLLAAGRTDEALAELARAAKLPGPHRERAREAAGLGRAAGTSQPPQAR